VNVEDDDAGAAVLRPAWGATGASNCCLCCVDFDDDADDDSDEIPPCVAFRSSSFAFAALLGALLAFSCAQMSSTPPISAHVVSTRR